MSQKLLNKKIILGITGSISAYKAAIICRELVKEGATVNVVMTQSATRFISPLTLENLSKNKVIVDMFATDVQSNGSWHIHLAQSADAMIIAPCSAASLARLAIGLSDNALIALAVALPENIPLILSPAMDSDMWRHITTQRNIKQLENDGAHIIDPDEGELASGMIGMGRLPDPIEIVNSIVKIISSERDVEVDYKEVGSDNGKIQAKIANDLNNLKLESIKEKFAGKRVLITAGPTYEKIDAVRFVGNYSSGKMGFALSEIARDVGCEVRLISGPTSLSINGVERIDIESADQMFEAVQSHFAQADLVIMNAAVADYKPIRISDRKIKKSEENITLDLVRNPDILQWAGSRKNKDQKIVGFALETDHGEQNAIEKMIRKNCDMLVLNYANASRSGFLSDENTITIFDRSGNKQQYSPMSKSDCAIEIFHYLTKF